MRTERRHELHTNVLADWLGVQIDRMRPYARMSVAVALGVVVLLGAGLYFRSQSTARQDQQWLDYYQAMDQMRLENKPEALIALVDSPALQRTPVGYWSACGLGDFYLRDGLNQLFSNRPAALERLKSAKLVYGQVAQQTTYPMLAQRALLDMGSAHEGLNELPEARKAYEKIISTWPGGSFETAAKQRLKELDRKSTPEFYDWFFAMNPQPRGISGPGVPGVRPGFGDLPREGSFTAPKADDAKGGGAPAIVPPTFVIPKSTPADPSTTPAEPPAGDAPATEPPASDVKATTPPADDAPPKEPPAATPEAGKPDATAPKS
jgi:hypothetical protein